MTETFTIPAHIEDGSLRLDAPLPPGILSVEVTVRVAGVPKARRSVAEYIRSLPTGSRTAEDIDKQFQESRADRM